VYHLQRGSIEHENKGLGSEQFDDNGQVHTFLQKYFLYWLEALSLIGRISEGVLALRILESLTVSDRIES
jgi:hypothetical protein